MSKKLKFNILDAFVIVFVLCIIFVVAFKATGSDLITNSGEFTKAKVVLKLSSMRDFTAEAVPGKDVDVFINENNFLFGKIISKNVEEAKTNQILADGTTIETVVSERYDVYVTIEVEGIQQDDGYYVNGTQYLSVGAANTFRANGSVFYGVIHEIKD